MPRAEIFGRYENLHGKEIYSLWLHGEVAEKRGSITALKALAFSGRNSFLFFRMHWPCRTWP